MGQLVLLWMQIRIFPQGVLAVIALVVCGAGNEGVRDGQGVRRGFLSAQWLSVLCQEQGLIPSCWSRSSEGQVQAGSIPLKCELSPIPASAPLGAVLEQEGPV